MHINREVICDDRKIARAFSQGLEIALQRYLNLAHCRKMPGQTVTNRYKPDNP
jgi:hypothetical protein